MKNKIGIFFGSDTGNTKKVSNIISKKIGNSLCDIFDISECTIEDIKKYNILIFGSSTWYYGEIQYDWLEFIPNLKKINFINKKIFLFGCGDQLDYSEYFCDSMYYIWKVVTKNKGKVLGYWPIKDYNFKKSKSIINEKYFLGLAIDEDRQPEKTNKRIENWVTLIKENINNV